MTAENVIMNKEAVAVAADSAVSFMGGTGDQPQKIYTSAIKPKHSHGTIQQSNDH